MNRTLLSGSHSGELSSDPVGAVYLVSLTSLNGVMTRSFTP